MLKKLLIPIIIFALSIVFFKTMLATKHKAPEITIDEHVWRVEHSLVEKQILSPSITLYGRVETSELLNAAAPGTSQVAQVKVKEGDYVEAGQLMLALDTADFEPLVMQSEGRVKELNALLKSEVLRHKTNLDSLTNEKKLLLLSKKALSRAEKVKRQKLGSISETEQAMQQVELRRLSYNKVQFQVVEHQSRQEQLEARLMQAQADLAKNRLALERSQIIAPFSGLVAKVNVAQGDRVNNNEKLLSFYSTEHLEIRAKLPVSILSEIQQSMQAGQTLKGDASNGSHHTAATLNRISGEAQASGVDAIFTLSAKKVHFRMGAIVVIRLQRPARDNLIKVPYQAMYGRDRLYRIKDNRLQSVQVKTVGEYHPFNEQFSANTIQKPTLLIASTGLETGDTILATHLPNAFSGLKVESVLKVEASTLTDDANLSARPRDSALPKDSAKK